MEVIKEYLIGIASMAVCWLLLRLYVGFIQLRDEDSKRGQVARLIGKIGSYIVWTYFACFAVCIIIGLIAIFT